jgi:prepilin-type processing-associated H-X9-DG protein
MRGVYMTHMQTGFRDVLDGTANTIMMGEVATDLGDKDKRTRAIHMATTAVALQDNSLLCRGLVDPARPLFWGPGVAEGGAANQLHSVTNGRGFQWASAVSAVGAMHTILPPNSEICSNGGDTSISIGTASSRHQGGLHVLMTDGAVRFITDSIEAGNSTTGSVFNGGGGVRAPGSVSPYGLWGALGTRANKEVIDKEF